MLEFPLDSHYDTVVTTDARSEPPGWSKTWDPGNCDCFGGRRVERMASRRPLGARVGASGAGIGGFPCSRRRVGNVLWASAHGTSLVVLDAAGIRWTRPAGAPRIYCGGGRLLRSTDGRAIQPARADVGAVAAAAVAARALVVASSPRLVGTSLLMGLKAKVFALAGRHDFAWLTRLRTGSPPRLPTALVGPYRHGVIFGGDRVRRPPHGSALLVGIGGLLGVFGSAPAPVRALAATVGAWIPVVFTPTVATRVRRAADAFGISMVWLRCPNALKHRGAWITTAGAAHSAMTRMRAPRLRPPCDRRRRTSPRRAALAVAERRGIRCVLARRCNAPRRQGYVSVSHPHGLGPTPALAGRSLVGRDTHLVAASSRGWRRSQRSAKRAPAIWIVVGVWAVALLAAYLTSPLKLDHMLRFSLDRELACPPDHGGAGLRDVRFPSAAAHQDRTAHLPDDLVGHRARRAGGTSRAGVAITMRSQRPSQRRRRWLHGMAAHNATSISRPPPTSAWGFPS